MKALKEQINLTKNTNYISGNLIKLYDENYGFIINDNSCILENYQFVLLIKMKKI